MARDQGNNASSVEKNHRFMNVFVKDYHHDSAKHYVRSVKLSNIGFVGTRLENKQKIEKFLEK